MSGVRLPPDAAEKLGERFADVVRQYFEEEGIETRDYKPSQGSVDWAYDELGELRQQLRELHSVGSPGGFMVYESVRTFAEIERKIDEIMKGLI